MIRSCKEGGKASQMHFPVFEQCKKSGNFPRSWWGTHLKLSPNQSLELWKDLSLRLMDKRFQKSSQVQFPSC